MPRILFKSKPLRNFDVWDGEPERKLRKIEESYNKKGFMLILNHEVFDDKTLVRPGTKVDEENLVKTFSKFNFQIEVYRDLSYKEIMKLIDKLSNKNFIDFSCLVVAVLSHGEEKNMVSAQDQYYEFDDTIVNPIAKNVTLLGSPKIFIINTCRGYERNVYIDERNYPKMEVDSSPSSVKFEINQKVRSIPYMKEILKLYSCYEGFVSYRNPLFGCRFINSLCKYLGERGHDTPIEDIFKLVCGELTDSKACLFVQCPMVSSTLTTKFCLGDLIKKENTVIETKVN